VWCFLRRISSWGGHRATRLCPYRCEIGQCDVHYGRRRVAERAHALERKRVEWGAKTLGIRVRFNERFRV